MSDRPAGERLQKVLAHAGIASRRAAEELIQAGRVSVDGAVVTALGTRVDPARAEILVDGKPLATGPTPVAVEHVTYLLNKPAGVVSTAGDRHAERTVIDLVPQIPRVYPVGRLDADSEGLLLLSNDGDLTYRLTHPGFAVEKEYEALVRGYVTQEALRQLREGVLLGEDPQPTAPARVDQIGWDGANTTLRFVIHEGRNRQIRRMMQAVNGNVLQLRRVRLGPLQLKDLAPGKWRRLTAAELAALDHAAGKAPVRRPAAAPPPVAPATVPPAGGRRPRGRPGPAGRNPGGQEARVPGRAPARPGPGLPRPAPAGAREAGQPSNSAPSPPRRTHGRPSPPGRPQGGEPSGRPARRPRDPAPNHRD